MQQEPLVEDPVKPTARTRRKASPAAPEGTETRSAILEATIGIMREEGYAAVSSRRIAARAGLRSKLVHYYFRSMDELFLAVYKRIEDAHFRELTKVLASPRPLRGMWQLNMDATNTAMVLELNALASHRKVLRAEIARASERLRLFQSALLERAMREAEGRSTPVPPMVLSVLALALSRLLAMDSVVGVDAGRDETLRWVEAFIDHVEGDAPFPVPAPTLPDTAPA
jgi:AcrR family transcriptional regulator